MKLFRTKKPAAPLTMEESYQKQLQAVQKMRRGVADVSTSRQRLDLQAADLQAAMDALLAQAGAATAARLDGQAATAMTRHAVMAEQLGDIVSQRDALLEQESMLIGALAQLQSRVRGFSVTAETLKASHSAADAKRRIGESLNDLNDPGMQ